MTVRGEPRRPGRPRDECVEAEIVEACLDLLVEVGFSRLTVDGVAARAGVGKATIYRRWPSKGALVLAASECVFDDASAPDTGTLRGDVHELTSAFVEHLQASPTGCLLPALAVEARGNPELAELVATSADERRECARTVLRRARDRGELRPGTDIEVVIDAVAGPAFYRMMITGGPPTMGWMAKVVDMVLDGISVEPADGPNATPDVRAAENDHVPARSEV